jgi:hypothetical protein
MTLVRETRQGASLPSRRARVPLVGAGSGFGGVDAFVSIMMLGIDLPPPMDHAI